LLTYFFLSFYKLSYDEDPLEEDDPKESGELLLLEDPDELLEEQDE